MNGDRIWIWGRRPVLEAMRSGAVRSVVIASHTRPSDVVNEIRDLARRLHLEIREVPGPEVQRVAPGQNTQGVIAEITRRTPVHIEDLMATLRKRSDDPFVLLLDQVQDPHNFGALLRTAEAAGVHGVIVPERRSAAVTGVVSKTSAGAMSYLDIAEVTNLARAVEIVRAAGIAVVGLDSNAEATIYSVTLRGPLALVIGGEESGLRRLTRERCDQLARIPMLGQIESLNASVAGSIALYEAVRQRCLP
jgi:23S rRNA (guanosine2251-2'-O)-methyltransferase